MCLFFLSSCFQMRLIKLIALNSFFILFINATTLEFEHDDDDDNNNGVCQTGIREDMSNYIYCARQNLTQIPKLVDKISLAFKSTIIYDELVLTENQIEILTQNSFDKNLKVRKVYIDLNPIKKINFNAFDNIRNYLEELYFEKPLFDNLFAVTNNIDYSNSEEEIIDNKKDDKSLFQSSVFKKCGNLRILSIKNYKIFQLDSSEFLRLSKLKKLIIKNSNLNFVSKDAFKGLEDSLIEIDLESNNLNQIPIDAITGLKQLKKLNLAQNQIYNIDISIFYMFSKSLQILDLSYNLIKTVKGVDKKENSSLKTLYLQNNELKWADFMNIIKNLLNLVEINVDFNKLNDIPADNDAYSDALLSYEQTTTLDNLKEVSLQGNNLNDYVLTKFMTNKIMLQNLTHINLARNKLLSIPEQFFTKLNLFNLKMLTLDRNLNLNLLKTTFNGLENSLETLSMNQIGFNFNSIEILNSLKNLKYLKVNGNVQSDSTLSMTRFDVNLIAFDAQNSNLLSIPKFICDSNTIQEIDLSYNKLKTIPETCLENKNSLIKLNLNSNPLKCDCKLNYLKSWLDNKYKANSTSQQDSTLFELLFDWRCSEPLSLKDKNFINLSKNDLKCEFASLLNKRINNTSTTSTSTTTTTTLISSTKQASEFLSYIINEESLFSNTLSVKSLSEVEEELEAKASMGNHVVDSLSNNTYFFIIGGIFGIATLILSILLLIYTIYIKKFDNYYEKTTKLKLAEDQSINSISDPQQPSYLDLSFIEKEASTLNTTATNNSNSSIIELFRKNYCNEKSLTDPNQYLVSQINDNVFNNFMNSDAIKNSRIYNSGNGNLLIIPNNTISSSLSSFSESTTSTNTNAAYPHLSTIPYEYYDSKYALSNFTHYV